MQSTLPTETIAATETTEQAPLEYDGPPPAVLLFLEDLAATALLRMGRPMKTNELTRASEGVSLPRAAIAPGLEGNLRLSHAHREWNLKTRTSREGLSRQERDRQPLEATITELLTEMGKPLPTAVIVREMSFMRGAYVSNMKEIVEGNIANARWLVTTGPQTYMHESLIFRASTSNEDFVAGENSLRLDPDYEELKVFPLPEPSGSLEEDAVNIIRATGGPLSWKMLGYLMWRLNTTNFDWKQAAKVLGSRKVFYHFVGGFLMLQEELPGLRAQIQEWAQEHGQSINDVDIVALLRSRRTPADAPAPRELTPDIMSDLKATAKRAGGVPTSLTTVMTDVLEIEPDDPQFVPTLHSLNDKLRADDDYLPVGIGLFLLRETVPAHVGEIPEVLRPVQLSVTDPQTDEPRDFEMSDEGLEGDCSEFIHDPEWGDIGEEVEVKIGRRSGHEDAELRYVVLNHHYRAGTIKLRRADEDFLGIQGALTRLPVLVENGNLEVWSSRDSGLVYGLGKWFEPLLPPSGGVLIFSREGQSKFRLDIGEPDKLTTIQGRRAAELEGLRDASKVMSLFELLQIIMKGQIGGMELPTLWAEVNMVRRTSKRLLCSVISGYHCYFFKQRGPEQILWHFDASKLDLGVMGNKKKFVRK